MGVFRLGRAGVLSDDALVLKGDALQKRPSVIDGA